MPSNKKISWGWKTLLAWTEISWGWKISSEQTNKMGLGNPACLNRNKLGMENLQTETRRGCVLGNCGAFEQKIRGSWKTLLA